MAPVFTELNEVLFIAESLLVGKGFLCCFVCFTHIFPNVFSNEMFSLRIDLKILRPQHHGLLIRVYLNLSSNARVILNELQYAPFCEACCDELWLDNLLPMDDKDAYL